ncbi:MAG: SUMF1/EgtB/PvdO family nonheme iron enzyme [Candidatus Thiothrix putei]|uniref:SUMF1/EgtB/PvdO family nonheme iron enzyme n=1 Tax=Candidatus Thiothrix putei TaxID=3080811 RepID=A0AA95HIQ4_9GAMM|nr:MAG: SUMF1/EgtB/PvdO family nonheme iron enzyme [Candidatus Thiothrix putei]
MPASFLFEEFSGKGSGLRDCRSEPEKHDDLLRAFTKYERLVLLGEPGTGKTFSLWRIAAEQARKTLAEPTGLLPVIIPLNRWTDETQSLQDFVLKQMGGLAGRFDELRRTKRLLPLLDALNEIPFDQRTTKLKQVKAFVNQPDFKHLLLTCRKRDYVDKLEQDMDRLTIEPLDPPRIHRFLHNYFAYFEQQRPGEFETDMAEKLFWQLAGGEPVKQTWERWQQQGKGTHWHDFWEMKAIPEDWASETRWSDRYRKQQLDDPRSLLKLAANPYLLFLITTLYARYRELPRSRIDLFGRFVKVLLEREEVEKAKCREYIPKREEMLQELKQLAWQLQSRTGDLKEARTVLQRVEAVQTMSEPRLEFAAAASLLELTHNAVRFSHQLLQEFFTAQRFKEEREAGRKACEIWSADSWWEPKGWEEAARLAAEYEAAPVSFLQWLALANPKLAAEIARDQQLPDALSGFRDQWQRAITDIKQYPNHHERHAISTALAWLDWDNRPGVGLNVRGLPDIDWVEIPAGEFTYQDGEHLSLPTYKMSRYPVTNAQFQVFVADGGYENDEWWEGLQKPDSLPNHSWTEGNRPVERVDWYESIAFCRWLSAKTNQEIRLPTEQEWEKAARGTDGREYPWGNGYKTGYANINETLDKVGEYNLQETSAVGIYPQGQSPYGLMDMSGNVWEWCLNKYEEPSMITPDLSGGVRVVRGGAWSFNTGSCRSSFRYLRHPVDRYFSRGFRLLCCFPH